MSGRPAGGSIHERQPPDCSSATSDPGGTDLSDGDQGREDIHSGTPPGGRGWGELEEMMLWPDGEGQTVN